jgi:hypothetical protein
MSEENKKFDIAQLLNFVNPEKANFTPKISQKHWEDAEILMLGTLIQHLKKRGINNQELKQIINERLDNFDKKRKEKNYSSSSPKDIDEAGLELEKIKKARDEINLSRLAGSKKLSEKTKKLLGEALKKAMTEKSKKNSIIVETKIDNTNKKEQIKEIPEDDAKKVNEMLDIAVKSGIINKQDLGL